jgi:nucleoside-diphosphate-sugar epimerase
VHILITGAAGFIGRNLTARLRVAGHHVTAVDDLSIPAHGPVPDHLIRQDVRQLVPAHLDGVDAVVHLAARKNVPDSFHDPDQMIHNIAVDQHLLTIAAAAGTPRILLASSCEVYGAANRVTTETDPVSPRSPYAAGKATTEHLAAVTAALHPTQKVTCLRLYNTYGPDEGPDAVVPAFLNAVTAGAPLTIEGDGTQSRDLSHIDDMTSMITTVLTSSSTPPPVLNLGSGTTVTIADVARHVLTAAATGTIAHVTARPNEITAFIADMSLYRTLYGPPPTRPAGLGIRQCLHALTGQRTPA